MMQADLTKELTSLDEQSTATSSAPEWLRALSPEARIKALMAMQRVSQSEIAEKHGIAKSDLCRVIKGRRRSLGIRKVIAAELGVTVSDLFGESLLK